MVDRERGWASMFDRERRYTIKVAHIDRELAFGFPDAIHNGSNLAAGRTHPQ